MKIVSLLFALSIPGLLISECGQTATTSQSQTQDSVNGASHKIVQIDWRAELAERQKQLERDPNSAFLHNQVAVAYNALGDFDHFDREIQTAIKLDAGNTIDCYVAYAVYKRRHLEVKALSVLEKALQIDPDNPFGHHERARIFENSKELQNALKEYERAQLLLSNVTSSAQNFQQDRWYYTDGHGNPYDVTPEVSGVANDVDRMRAAASGKK
jgi:Tfp pilus assembly protein PilF